MGTPPKVLIEAAGAHKWGAGAMSCLLRVAGSAVQVDEVVAMEESRAHVCRREWCSTLGFSAV